jgi:shikimate dehydrogenase
MRRPERLVLLGHPVAHSLSPRMQGAALKSAGISLVYEALDVEPSAFDTTIAELRAEGAAGNVTVPYKERLRVACDVVTPLGGRVGAANTFWVGDDGSLAGDNTDVGGFDAMVRELIGGVPSRLTVGLVGAGGAAAAVLAAVESWDGCIAHVYNRTPERARILCERFGSVAHPVDDIGAVAGAQLVVNATSVGLRDDAFPVDPSLIAPEAVVVDLVYRLGETAWVKAARARGHRSRDGLAMLVEQGALAFERWFGVRADRAAMWASVRRGDSRSA